MKLKTFPELLAFLSTHLSDSDPESDEQTARSFAESAPAARRQATLAQARQCLDLPELPVEEFGMEANRWFGGADEARAWLARLVAAIESAAPGAGDADAGPVTRDSNGNALADGDTVTLIKDLDVKGMNFTAKRGTVVKNITLTSNPEHIEGKVNGTTIVLVTRFLKKA